MTAETLVRSGKISQFEYDIYTMYEGNDLGRRMLKHHLIAAVMEEPPANTSAAFAWQDGRRSVWREINLIIMEVTKKMEKSRHDRRDPSTALRDTSGRAP